MPLPREENADLAFGRHSLRVFSEPRFKRLALKQAPEERRAHWLVFHEGRQITVPKQNSMGYGLVQLMRDPARKGNLLALRKDDLSNFFGAVRIFTVSPAGEETPLGHSFLTRDPGRQTAVLSTVGLVPFALRRISSRNLRINELKKKMLDTSSRLNQLAEARTSPEKRERMRDILMSSNSEANREWFELEQSLRFDPIHPRLPPGLRAYSYRGKGLGDLLIAVQEELARSSGSKAIEGAFAKETTGRFLPKHGWTVINEKPSTVHCRKEFSQ
ncbi:hypothetical protein H0O03_01650 [Candidatus Micrarchaeota archaeon]|nr:hypothetical protein [Candidatus Micrarchaeota archaeon]